MVKRRATQKDVARLAGVSVTTVSQVINNRTGGNIRISEETRERVRQAVQSLEYSPNASARSLRTQKTHLLAVLVPDITNPFYPELIRGVQGVAVANDYDLLVYDADDRPEREAAFVEAMLRRQVDGIAMVPFYLKAADIRRLTEAGIAVAVTIKDLSRVGADVILINDTQAMDDMFSHLIAKGHRRIAHLTGTLDTIAGQSRLDGYRHVLAAAGIPYDETLVGYGNFRADCVPAFLDNLFMPGREPPTALFAANDVMAIAAIYELRRRGFRVPEDVAVCGYDDIPEARLMIPGLTTITQKTQQMGMKLAQLLVRRLDSRLSEPEQEVPFKFDFVCRDST